jgi:hypothetical protein
LNNTVTVIAKFIKIPMFVLALRLLDLMDPLALKVANIGGSIDNSKNSALSLFFVDEWVYIHSLEADLALNSLLVQPALTTLLALSSQI